MSNNIILKKSSVGDKVPLASDLEHGELALNFTDGNLFYKNNSNVVTTIASNKFVSVTGNVTAVGNISGNYFIGNGALLTGLQTGFLSSTVNDFVGDGSTVAFTLSVTPTSENLTSVNISGVSQLRTAYSVTGNVMTFTSAPPNGSAVEVTTLSGSATSVANIANGTTVIDIPVINGNATVSVGGNANVLTITSTGANITGTVSATGNITGANLVTAGAVTGNGRALTSLSATNIDTGTLDQSRLANAAVTLGSTALTLGETVTTVTGLTSVTSTTFVGALTGAATTAATVTTAAQPNITSTGTLTSVSTSGNLTFSSTGQRILGDFSNATVSSRILFQASSGTFTDIGAIGPGAANSSAWTAYYGNNPTNTSRIRILALADAGYLQSSNTGSGSYVPLVLQTGGSNRVNIDVNGNVGIANGTPTHTLSVTGTFNVSGNANVGNIGATSVSASGNVTGGNLITAGLVSLSSITKTGTNGVGNIGAAASTFNTVFAKATSAQYADLAEIYTSDAEYPAGTVVVFGGAQEITASTEYAQTSVAGVVSTNPAYLMNSAADGQPVALTGRVPCRVVGNIRKGDLITSSATPGVATRLDPADWQPGVVIGKALANYNSNTEGVIEAVVGRV